MADIKNVIHYETGVLTDPTDGTVLYDHENTGVSFGKGLRDIYLTASAPITVAYTTIYGAIIPGQLWTATNPINLGGLAIKHLELAADLTGTLEVIGNEMLD